MDREPSPQLESDAMSHESDRTNGAPQRSPAEIHREIQRTRADLDDTLNALERKLSPDRVRYEARERLSKVVEERPLLATASAAGIGWMVGRLIRRLASSEGSS